VTNDTVRTIKVEKILLGPARIQTQDYDSVSKYQKPLKYHLSTTFSQLDLYLGRALD
jgi:hypothetical protein